MSDERPASSEQGGDAGREPAAMSRRRALLVLGAVPLVGAGALAAQQQGQQSQTRQTHEGPNQPARDTRQPARSPKKPGFFTARERRTARVLADDVIPKDERSGSASEAGVVEFMDVNLSREDTTPETRVAWRGGLRWLDTESRRRFGVAYAAAAAAQRHLILDDLAWPDRVPPAMAQGAAFFARFRDMTAAGFFSSAEGWRDLQYAGDTMVREWKGCPQPALDKLGVSYDRPRRRDS